MRTSLGVLAFVCVLLVAAPSGADWVVPGYTLVPVTAADCSGISVARQTDGQGGTVVVVTFTFDIKDSLGAVRQFTSVSAQPTPAQRTSLGTFITNVGVPLANTAEGL